MLRCDQLLENYVNHNMSVETKGKTQVSYTLGRQPCDKAAMLGVNTIEFFFRRIYMTTEFSSQRSEILLFLTTNMHASHDVTCEPAIERFYDVTMAILVSQNNETVAMLVFQTSPHSCGS